MDDRALQEERGDTVSQVSPGASAELAHLSNAELLACTQRLVGKSNQVLAALLAHLAEVESRGLHRLCACSTLYTYCIYELRFSEDAASRRASAAKWVRRFPPLLDAVAAGELHLTGLLQLAPVLTDLNCMEVLARAKFRTKKELAKLVRKLAPLPALPDRIEPLGPELPASPRNPTWQQFVESLCPPVRQLPVEKQPAEWARQALAENRDADTDLREEEAANTDTVSSQVSAPAPARGLPPLEEPQLYQLKFATSEEHVELIDRAEALLDAPKSLGELHLQAMRLLVDALEKKKYGARQSAAAPPHDEPYTDEPADPSVAPEAVPSVGAPREPSRYLAAWLRRAVFERDTGQCTYVDERGVRCRETHFLEFHHLLAFAKAGRHRLENVTLRCRCHNALAAEQDFGREHIERHRETRHHSRRKVGNVA